MARTVCIYADGSDLHEEAERLVAGFSALVERWNDRGAHLVNQVHEREPDMGPDDLPDWSLGINVPLSEFHVREVEELLPVLRHLAESTGREFVIGVAEESGITDDTGLHRSKQW